MKTSPKPKTPASKSPYRQPTMKKLFNNKGKLIGYQNTKNGAITYTSGLNKAGKNLAQQQSSGWKNQVNKGIGALLTYGETAEAARTTRENARQKTLQIQSANESATAQTAAIHNAKASQISAVMGLVGNGSQSSDQATNDRIDRLINQIVMED